jgi:hypothetical protein
MTKGMTKHDCELMVAICNHAGFDVQNGVKC